MEVIQRNYAVALMIDPHKRVLMQKKDSGYWWGPNKWCTFGGGIKKGEKSIDALLREIPEETGIIPERHSLIYVQDFEEFSAIGPVKKRTGKIYNYAVNFEGDMGDVHVREGAGCSLFEEGELEKYNRVGLVIPTSYMGVRKLFDLMKEGKFKL